MEASYGWRGSSERVRAGRRTSLCRCEHGCEMPPDGERDRHRRDAISTRPGCIRKSRRKWRAMVWIIMFPKRKTRSHSVSSHPFFGAVRSARAASGKGHCKSAVSVLPYFYEYPTRTCAPHCSISLHARAMARAQLPQFASPLLGAPSPSPSTHCALAQLPRCLPSPALLLSHCSHSFPAPLYSSSSPLSAYSVFRPFSLGSPRYVRTAVHGDGSCRL